MISLLLVFLIAAWCVYFYDLVSGVDEISSLPQFSFQNLIDESGGDSGLSVSSHTMNIVCFLGGNGSKFNKRVSINCITCAQW